MGGNHSGGAGLQEDSACPILAQPHHEEMLANKQLLRTPALWRRVGALVVSVTACHAISCNFMKFRRTQG